MTFININGTRIKVSTIFVYQPGSQPQGTLTNYFIDVGQQTAGVQSRTILNFPTQAAQSIALGQLDAAVAAFAELALKVPQAPA